MGARGPRRALARSMPADGAGSVPGMRIVSLPPSATEMHFALGAGDDVVGVTFECDSPPEARTRRIVSTSALPEGLGAAEIDAVVATRMAAGEDLYHLDEGGSRRSTSTWSSRRTSAPSARWTCRWSTTRWRTWAAAARYSPWTRRTWVRCWRRWRRWALRWGVPGRRRWLQQALRERLVAVRDAVDGRRRVSAVVLEWTDPPVRRGRRSPPTPRSHAPARASSTGWRCWPPCSTPRRSCRWTPGWPLGWPDARVWTSTAHERRRRVVRVLRWDVALVTALRHLSWRGLARPSRSTRSGALMRWHR